MVGRGCHRLPLVGSAPDPGNLLRQLDAICSVRDKNVRPLNLIRSLDSKTVFGSLGEELAVFLLLDEILRDSSNVRSYLSLFSRQGREDSSDESSGRGAPAPAAGSATGGQELRAPTSVEPKLRRLLKADLVAVFRELAAQGEALLALRVFEEIRKEHWYTPNLLWYVDLVTVLASKGLRSEFSKACSYLKREQLGTDTDGFNLLLKALLDAEFTQLTMDCFRLMKLWDSEPERITYRTLIKGLESLEEMDLSADIRLEAENDYGDHLDFLNEDMVETCTSSS